jgi:hypothetical protein
MDYDLRDIMSNVPQVQVRLTIEDMLPGSEWAIPFFLKLQVGVSKEVAGASLGIPPDEINKWFSRGCDDYHSGNEIDEQSSYAHFYKSCIQNISIKAGIAEAQVAEDMPLQFLQRGSPTSLVGNRWEEPRNLQFAQTNVTTVNIQDNSQSNVIQVDDLEQLLAIAKEVGLGQTQLLDQEKPVLEPTLKDHLIKNRAEMPSPDGSPASDMMKIANLMKGVE